MRIGIDIRPLQTGSAWRGVGVYTRHLIRSLLRLCGSHDYVFFAFSGNKLDAIPDEMRERTVFLKRPIKNIILWDQVFSYRLFKNLELDIYHSPFYAVPAVVPEGLSVVQTIHDLTPVLFTGSTSIRNRIVFAINFRLSRRADRIIAVSNNTRNDIIKNLRIPEQKILVIYNGGDHLPHERETNGMPGDSYFKQKKPYLLYVGGFDPMKNIPVLIQAFDMICIRNHDMKLLFVGAGSRMLQRALHSSLKGIPAGRRKRVSRIIRDLMSSGRIIGEGFVKQANLLSCYRNAELFVFPSRYEGFGLPPLEAMQCGVPVIASNRGSLPEILGEAAVYVDPEDPVQLAAKIEDLLYDEGAKMKMRSMGHERASRFLWEEAARKTLRLYEELYGEKKRVRSSRSR